MVTKSFVLYVLMTEYVMAAGRDSIIIKIINNKIFI